jgi:hypothetical protein
MSRPTVYADFHNADSRGRVRLNCLGTIRDLTEKQITLSEGLQLTLTDDGLEVDGEVHFAQEEHLWVAIIDWAGINQTEEYIIFSPMKNVGLQVPAPGSPGCSPTGAARPQEVRPPRVPPRPLVATRPRLASNRGYPQSTRSIPRTCDSGHGLSEPVVRRQWSRLDWFLPQRGNRRAQQTTLPALRSDVPAGSYHVGDEPAYTSSRMTRPS